MVNLTRRQFIQSSPLLLGAMSTPLAFGAGSRPLPTFAKGPVFEPTALFLTWQRDPTTTMTVQWVGSERDGALRPIWYAKDGTAIWQNQPCTARRFPMTDRWIFRTELTGLEPGPTIGSASVSTPPRSVFETMPAKATDTIHFVSGGDSGIGPHAVMTNHVAAAQSPMFVVLGGDIAYESGKAPAIFLQLLKNYSRDLRDDRHRLIPLLGCVGNHEVAGNYGKTRKRGSVLLCLLRRPVPRDRLRQPRLRRLPVAHLSGFQPHLAG